MLLFRMSEYIYNVNVRYQVQILQFHQLPESFAQYLIVVSLL